jgi:hypothetical protein
MCPHLDLLDEIYGTKVSIISLFVHDTSSSEAPQVPQGLPQVHVNEQVDEESQMQATIDDSTQPRISTVEQRVKSAHQKRKGGSVPGPTALAESNKMRCEFQFAELELNRENNVKHQINCRVQQVISYATLA